MGQGVGGEICRFLIGAAAGMGVLGVLIIKSYF
jgi:hypothetical protein